jgi:hypothetical protein
VAVGIAVAVRAVAAGAQEERIMDKTIKATQEFRIDSIHHL